MKKIAIVLAVAAVIAIAVLAYFNEPKSSYGSLDCATNTTCLPSLKLTGNPSGDAFEATSDNATTSIEFHSTSSTKGACIEMNATSSATTIRFMFSTIATSTYNGFVTWAYGACN